MLHLICFDVEKRSSFDRAYCVLGLVTLMAWLFIVWNHNSILVCLFVWVERLFFKHLMSYHDGACLQQWYFDQCAATQECHVADTGHDTPPRHSIQTQDMTPHPVTVYRHGAAVLSTGVKHHTGIHSFPF